MRFVTMVLAAALAAGPARAASLELLNVSYDPTRELWRDINASFIPDYEKKSGTTLEIKQSHGGSGSQATLLSPPGRARVSPLRVMLTQAGATSRREPPSEPDLRLSPHPALP